MIAVLTVSSLALNGCSHSGNQALQQGTLGISISIVAGNKQSSATNQLFKSALAVKVYDPVLGSPIQYADVDFTQLTSTDANVLIPTMQTNEFGVALTQVRAPSLYNQDIKIEARIRGTNTTAIFELKTIETGLGTAYTLDTTHSGIETAGKKFGFIIKVVDEQGNVVSQVNDSRTLLWTWQYQNSWTGVPPSVPEGGITCKFENGICNTAQIYYLTDVLNTTKVWMGDGPGGLNDVFGQVITVLPDAKKKVVMANRRGGPAGADGNLTTTLDNATPVIANMNYTADSLPVSFFAAATDPVGNYIEDVDAASPHGTATWTVGTESVFDQVEKPTLQTTDFMTNHLTIAPSGGYVTFVPYTTGSADLTLSATDGLGGTLAGVTWTVRVDSGNPNYLDVHTGNHEVEVAGHISYVQLQARDGKGNIVKNNASGTRGYTGNFLTDFALVYPGPSGPNGNGWPPPLTSVGCNGFSTDSSGCDSTSGRAQTFFNGVGDIVNYVALNNAYPPPISPTGIAIAPTAGTGFPKIRVTTSAGGGFPSLTGMSPSIGVQNTPPSSINVYYEDLPNNPGSWLWKCWRNGYMANFYCLQQTAGDPPTTYKAAVEDDGGNILNWPNAITWTPAGAFAGTQWSPQYGNSSTFSPVVAGVGTITLQDAPTGSGLTTQWTGNTQLGILDHFIVSAIDTGGLFTNNISTVRPHYLQITAKDNKGNATLLTGNVTLTVTYSGVSANSPKGTPSRIPAAGPQTYNFVNGVAQITNLYTPTATDSVHITVVDTASHFSCPNEPCTVATTLIPTISMGSPTTLKIRSLASGLGTDFTFVAPTGTNPTANSTINADMSPNYYGSTYDAEANFISSTNSITWSGSILGNDPVMGRNYANLTSLNPGPYAALSIQSATPPPSQGVQLHAHFVDPANPANILDADTGLIMINAGQFDHLNCNFGGYNGRAGVPFTLHPSLVDVQNNVLFGVSGVTGVQIAAVGATQTIYGDYTTGPYGTPMGTTQNLNFTAGQINDPALTPFTFYGANPGSSQTRVEFTVFGQTHGCWFNVVNQTPDHIRVERAATNIYAGSNHTYTVKEVDFYGNIITWYDQWGGETAAGTISRNVALSFVPSPALLGGSNIVSTDQANLAPTGPGLVTAVTGDLNNGMATVVTTATQSGTMRLGAVPTTPFVYGPTGPAGPRYTRAQVEQTVTVDPQLTISSVDWYVQPQTTYTASNSVPMTLFKAAIKDVYGNIIYQNNTDQITVERHNPLGGTGPTGWPYGTGSLGVLAGDSLTQTVAQGVAIFGSVTYPRAEPITLHAYLNSNPSISADRLITVNPGPPLQSIVLIKPYQTHIPGVATAAQAVSGTVPPQVAGVPINVEIRAVDDGFNVVTSYSAPVQPVTATSGHFTAPAPLSFVAGVAAFTGASAAVDTTATVTPAGTGPQHQMIAFPGLSFNNPSTPYDVLPNTSDPNHRIVLILPGETLDPGQLPIQSGKSGSPTTRSAGTAFSITAFATDNWFNVLTDNTSQVTVSTYGPTGMYLNTSAASQSGTLANGQKSFNFTYYTATTGAFADPSSNNVGYTILNPSTTFTVSPLAANQTIALLPGQTLLPGQPSMTLANAVTGTPVAQTAGAPFHASVYAVDQYFNPNTTVNGGSLSLAFVNEPHNSGSLYTGTFASGFADIVLTNYYATSGHTLQETGSVFATHNVSSPYTVNTQATPAYALVVLPGQTFNPGFAAIGSVVQGAAPASETAGTGFNVDVYLTDNYGNQMTANNSAAGLASSDVAVAVSGPANFSGGHQTYNVIHHTAAANTTLHSNSGFSNSNSTPYLVVPGPATQLAYTTQPANPTVAGAYITPVVAIEDQFGNIATTGPDSTATVTLSLKTGTGAFTGPSLSMAAVGGVASFGAAQGDYFNLVGAKVITATKAPAGVGTLSADSASFNITNAPAAVLAVTGVANPATAGVATNVQVVAKDQFGNIAQDYAGTIQLGVTDPSGVVPANYPFVPGTDFGSHFFSNGITFKHAGTWNVTAADIAGGSAPTGILTGISVNPAGASQLALAGPASATAGVCQGPYNVTAQDSFSNASNLTSSKTINITGGGSGSFFANATDCGNGTPAVTGIVMPSGTSTFAFYFKDTLTQSLTFNVQDSGATLTAATQGVVVGPNTAHHLAFGTQPVNSTAGTAIPAMTVQVQDIYNNIQTSDTRSISMAILNNAGVAGTGTLSGTTAVNAASGVSTYGGLSIDKSGTGYTLQATTTGLTVNTVASTGFNITSANASQIVYVTPPAPTGVAGSPLVTQPVVKLMDPYGNQIRSNDPQVGATLSLEPHTTGSCNSNDGSPLVAPTGVVSSTGIVAFTNFGDNRTGSHFVKAVLGALTPACAGVATAIKSAPASQVAFTTQPAPTGTTGQDLVTQPVVQIQDPYGNLIDPGDPNVSNSIALAAYTNSNCSSGGGGALNGSPVTAVSGQGTFVHVNYNVTGNLYLKASSAALATACSSAINVSGIPNHLAYQQGDAQTATVNTTLPVPPGVVVLDAFNNPIPGYTINFQVQGNNGNLGAGGPTGSVVTSPTGFAAIPYRLGTVAGANSVLAFNNALPAGPTGYTFNETGVPDVPNKLAFTVAPTGTISMVAIAPAVQVTVQDTYGNTITAGTGASANVTMTIATNPPGTGSFQSSTTTVAAVTGVATFNNLKIDKAGIGYTIAAASTPLTSATSVAFNVAPAAPTQLVFAGPINVGAGVCSPAFTVTAQDPQANISNVTTNTTISLGGAGSGTFYSDSGCITSITSLVMNSGTSSVTYYFKDNTTESLSLTATATAGMALSATGGPLTVNPGPPTQLAFTTQPTSAVAGTGITPAIVVKVQDALGNTVTAGTGATASITLGFAINAGTGTLTTALNPVSASSGVATFSGAWIDKAASGYKLNARVTGSGITAATSAAFNITPAPPSQLALAGPATLTAGVCPPSYTITSLDPYGNISPVGGTQTINLTGQAGGNFYATSNCTAGTVGAVALTGGNSSVTFSYLDTTAESPTLNAAISGNPLTASNLGVVVNPSSPDHLAFTAQPTTQTAGASISPSVQVTVQDQYNNRITTSSASVAMAIGVNAGSGTLSGTTTQAAPGNGIATFNNLSINRTGTGYQLAATSAGVTGATSASFNITPATASQLVFTVAPTGTVSMVSIAPSVQVAVEDSLGNIITSGADSTRTIGIAIGNNPGAGSLQGAGPYSVAASSGVATFSNIKIDKAGTGYTLSATNTGLTAGTSPGFNIIPAAPTGLAWAGSGTITAGACTTAYTISALDPSGNVSNVTSPTTVTLSSSGSGQFYTAANCLSGNTSSISITNGTSSQTIYYMDNVAENVTLTASTSGGMTLSASSLGVTVVPGAPSKLAFTIQPPASGTAGTSLAPLAVTVQDANGNTVVSGTGSSSVISLGMATSPTGATFLAGQTATASSGVATFSGVQLGKAGSYTFNATSSAPSLSSASNSNTVNIGNASASKLAFTVQPPSSGAAGTSLASFSVTVQDTYGNTVTAGSGSAASVSLGLSTSPGGSSILSGGTVTASGGVANFNAVQLDKVGSYTFNASSTAPAVSSAADSSAVSIGNGAASKLAFTVQPPANGTSASSLSTFAVTVQDAQGNTVTAGSGASASITLGIASGPGGASIMSGGTVTASTGVATFSGVQLDKAGSYTLNASSSAPSVSTSSNSTSISIANGPAAKLAFTAQPPANGTAGSSLASFVVTVQDAQGNTVTAGSGTSASISLGLASSPGGASILAGGTVTASTGVATFSGVQLDKAGSYQFNASSSAPNVSTAANSTAVSVGNAAATALAFTVQPPANGTAGTSLASFAVTVQDSYGNTVTAGSGSAASISLSLASSPGGASILAGGSVTASAGVATFNGVQLDKVGNYTFNAGSSAPSLSTGGASSTVTIANGAASQLAFTIQPPANGTSASSLSTFAVTVQDAQGNTVTAGSGATASISLGLASSPGGASIMAGGTVSAVTGVATFSGVQLDKAGSYTFNASSSAPSVSSGSNSTAVSIGNAAASKLAFTIQPPANGTAGTSLASFAVTVQDAQGNTVTAGSGATASISLGIASGPGGGAILGGGTVTASTGVATFTGVQLNKTGSYALNASSSAPSVSSSSNSNSISIVNGAPTQLAFGVQPTDTLAGATMSSFTVTVLDAQGNTVTAGTGSGSTITLTPSASSITAGPTATAASGVATFSAFKMNAAGNYTLVAAASAPAGISNSAASSPFNITPSRLAITAVSGTFAATSCSQPFTVTSQDANSATANVNSTTTVNLSSNGAGLTFYSDFGCKTSTTSVTIPSGSNSTTFYVSDSATEAPTLTSAVTSWTNGTLGINVIALASGAATIFNGTPTGAYGTVSANTTQTFTLANSGGVAAATGTTSIVAPTGTAWTITADNCNNTTVAASGNCTISVQFNYATAATGSYTGTLKWSANPGGTSAVNLSATK